MTAVHRRVRYAAFIKPFLSLCSLHPGFLIEPSQLVRRPFPQKTVCARPRDSGVFLREQSSFIPIEDFWPSVDVGKELLDLVFYEQQQI